MHAYKHTCIHTSIHTYAAVALSFMLCTNIMGNGVFFTTNVSGYTMSVPESAFKAETHYNHELGTLCFPPVTRLKLTHAHTHVHTHTYKHSYTHAHTHTYPCLTGGCFACLNSKNRG
jgi:hypothetical protein